MTTVLVPADRMANWSRLKALVLDTVPSPITKRVYNMALDEFFAWYAKEPRPGFNKAIVNAWRNALEKKGIGPISINIRLTAVRKLAVEAADNGLVAPEVASAISRVKGLSARGVRTGNWLSLQQAQALLIAPNSTTKKGLRDRAMLAVLVGCGLRRSEVASMTMRHVQLRDNRWPSEDGSKAGRASGDSAETRKADGCSQRGKCERDRSDSAPGNPVDFFGQGHKIGHNARNSSGLWACN